MNDDQGGDQAESEDDEANLDSGIFEDNFLMPEVRKYSGLLAGNDEAD